MYIYIHMYLYTLYSPIALWPYIHLYTTTIQHVHHVIRGRIRCGDGSRPMTCHEMRSHHEMRSIQFDDITCHKWMTRSLDHNIYVYIYIYIYTYMYIHVCTCTYICTHIAPCTHRVYTPICSMAQHLSHHVGTWPRGLKGSKWGHMGSIHGGTPIS